MFFTMGCGFKRFWGALGISGGGGDLNPPSVRYATAVVCTTLILVKDLIYMYIYIYIRLNKVISA